MVIFVGTEQSSAEHSASENTERRGVNVFCGACQLDCHVMWKTCGDLALGAPMLVERYHNIVLLEPWCTFLATTIHIHSDHSPKDLPRRSLGWHLRDEG